MQCPKDKTELKQITKEDVIIDFCPNCRGVWLDRGELDKIIDRSAEEYSEKEGVEAEKKSDAEYPDINRAGSFKTRHGYKGPSSFLGALFDLDDRGVDDRRGFLGRKR